VLFNVLFLMIVSDEDATCFNSEVSSKGAFWKDKLRLSGPEVRLRIGRTKVSESGS